jgi:hypothetical protein
MDRLKKYNSYDSVLKVCREKFQDPYIILFREHVGKPYTILNQDTGYVLTYSGIKPMWYCTDKENLLLIKLAIPPDSIQWHSDLDDFEEILSGYLDQHGAEFDDIPVPNWNPLMRLANTVRVRNDNMWATKLKLKNTWVRKPG